MRRARVLTAITVLGVALPPASRADAATSGNANLHLDKTVGSASVAPVLSVSLGVDRTSAIPRDVLTYTAQVTNTGAVLHVSGDLVAQNSDAVTATVASYYDAISTTATAQCGASTQNQGHDTAQWTPLAGTAAAQSGYTPVATPPVSTGLQLQVTPVAAGGVTYPSGGDELLGTTIAPGATATWHYTASVILSPAQVATVLDRSKVSRIRNTLHVEPTPRTQRGAGQPPTVDVDFCQQFFSTNPSGAATGVGVTITPQGASPVTIDQSTVSALAAIASGASVSVSMQYAVPRVPAKGVDETDSDYLARLAAVEGSTLQATATATASSSGGPLSAGPALSPPTTLHVPIVGIAKSGPASADAGTTPAYPLALTNSGGAAAGPLTVVDSVPDGSTGAVSGVPAALAPHGSATAQATFAIPIDQPGGGLTDTASVSWQDANGDAYGPVSSQFTTQVQPVVAASSLSLSPAVAGPDVVGTQQSFTATLLDHGGKPVAGKTVTFTVTGANGTGGTAVTDANGNATFAYTGSHNGVDTAQASFSQGSVSLQSNTATVGWITPITPISTSTVQGNFFAESGTQKTFVAKPGDVPAFGQSFPTVDFNPPSGANLWLGNDTQGNFFETDTGGAVLAQQGLAVTGVASDGSHLYVGDANGNITKRSLDGTTVIDSFSVHNAGSPSEDLAWDGKRNVLWRIDHSPATLDEINPATHALVASFPLPQADPAAPAMTPLGGLGLAYDSVRDRLYASFCQVGCSSLGQGLVRVVDPSSGTVVADLFQSPFITAGLGIDTGSDTLWAGGDGMVRNLNLHGQVLSSFPRPQPGGLVDGLEVVKTTKTPIVNHNISGVGPQTRPFTDVTTDQLGNYTGTIVAQGNGVQAGVGTMQSFDAELSANFTVAKPGDVTFDIVADDGFMLGVGGGASRVSGAYENAPPSNTSPFLGYPLVGAFNQQGGNTPGTYAVTVHFPAAGSYPYELDHFECCGAELSLTMTIEQFTADTSPLSVYAAYADGLRPAGSIFPFPWQGSPGVSFVGNGATPYDSGALRFDNNSDAPIVLDDVAVDIGPYHFDLWGSGIQIAPHGITILTQTSGNNFDSSDTPITCSPTGFIPQVHYTIAGVTTTFADTTQVLNTKGTDPPSCGGGNESIPWTRIGGGGTPIHVPLPPAVALSLTPTTVSGDTVGTHQALTVTALDGSGLPVAGLPVAFSIFGANTQSLTATTDAHGVAQASYTGGSAGTDTVTAAAFVSGLRNVSNALTVPWVIPAPASQPAPTSSGANAPQIANLVPANGAVLTAPTAVTATITPPAGTTISSYSVTMQNTAGGSAITIGSGSGAPPASLANLDPALFAAGTYTLTVSATSSSGGSASLGNVVTIGSGSGTVAQSPPSISTPKPADGTTVTVPVPITATLTPPAGQTIASWKVTAQALDPEPAITLASGTGAPPSPLATLDPTVLANDTYAITVSATASGGGTQTTTTTVAVAGNMKLGRYVTSFDDLNVPVNGFPMQVMRSYDSIDTRSGDFGVGWRVSVSNFRVSSNRSLGLGGWAVQPTQCFFGLCNYGFTSSTAHYVTVTFPDNRQETFDFTPANTGGPLFYWQGNAAFTARQGVTSTLQAEGDTGLTYGFDGNLYDSNFDPYNPTAFALTTVDGRVLHLNTTSGLVSESDAQGNTLSIDSLGVHSSTGASITFTRDGSGRITTTNGPSGQTISYSYSAAGDLASVTDAAGNVTTYTYDSSHHLLSVSGPGRPQRTLSYDSSGRLVAITDAAGNTARISSDVGARQQTIQDPNGRLTTVDSFDDAGDLIREDKVFGTTTQTTTWTYDSVGHMLTQTDPDGGVITFTYDAAGHVLSTTDADGHTTTYTRNSFGEPLTEVTPDGVTDRTLTYDAHGHLLTQTRADGSHTTYTYDSAGNLLTSTDELGHVTSRTYDSSGHLLSLTDPDNHTTTYTYDASGHPLSIKDPIGNITAFSYDGNGHITAIVDPQGRTQTFTYDAVGHMTSAVDASGKTTSYVHDAVGQLAKRTDRNGGTTTYTYDADSSMTAETLPDGSQTTWAYDALERPVSIGNSAETIGYTYTSMSAVASQSTAPTGSSGMPSVTLSYAYDHAGAQLSATGPDGTTSYAYDTDSRLTTLTAPGSQAYGFTYDTAGRLSTETRPNGVTDSLAYDAAGQLLGRTSRLGATAVVAQANYAYDPAGLRTSMTDLSGTSTYAYNADDELVGATHPASSGLATESYTYNASGDRATSATDPLGSITYDSGGRLSADATHTYQYDAEGDLVRSTATATGATTAYTWDADHRLLSVTHPDGSVSRYGYDGLGRRVEAQDPTATTKYVYDGSNVRLEYDGGNALQTAYAETMVPGDVLAQTRGGQSDAYTQDGLGSTTSLLDSSGHATASYAYDSFGRPAASNPTTPAQTFSYTGQTYDASTGLYYDRARYYDPGTGRFLSEDPVQHANRYAYVGNDPTNMVDPSGAQELVEESETIAIDEAIDEAAISEEESAFCEEGSVLGDVLGAGLSSNAKGQLAEQYVSDNFLNGLAKNTDVLTAPSGAGRIPDFVNASNQFFEVKNVGSLSYTRQLRDFVDIAGDDNPVNIFIRGSTNVSGPLAEAARDGKVNLIRCLPG